MLRCLVNPHSLLLLQLLLQFTALLFQNCSGDVLWFCRHAWLRGAAPIFFQTLQFCSLENARSNALSDTTTFDTGSTPPKTIKFWPKEEINTFLEYTKDHAFFDFYVTTLNTGMRLGEILGFQWVKLIFSIIKLLLVVA